MVLHEKTSKVSKRGKTGYKAILAALVALPLFTQMPYQVYANSIPAASLELQSEEPLTSGAILKNYIWRTDRKGTPVTVQAKVVQVDLKNPYVKLDTMAGTGGQFTKNQTILGMAKETKAVAATNGDFYNTKAEGVPIGPQIMDSKLMATPPDLPGFYSFAITKDNKPIVDLFKFQGQIKAKNGKTYPLGGINKTYYWFEPSGVHSHIDGLFMYTNAWGQEDRSNDGVTSPTEVLVVNNTVVQIVQDDILRMVAPKDGYILRAAGKAAEFVMANLKVGDRITADYSIHAQDPTKSYDYKTFKTMVGGHTIMVDEGKPAAYSREVASLAGYRSRTAVGYSKDERYAYLITADNWGDSKGLSMGELQDLMLRVGVWKGINLDGGGSTQMVARPLGETEVRLINQTETGSQRRVVNGLGVFSLAPKGQLKGLKVEGERTLFVGEKAIFGFKAYDEFYNPFSMAGVQTNWSTSKPIGSFTEPNTFVATQKGTTTLTVTAGAVKEALDVQVAGRDDIQSISVKAYPTVAYEGQDIQLKVTAMTKSGASRTVPADLLQWEFKGMTAEVQGNTLKVTKLDNNASSARLTGRYDGFSTGITIPYGVKKLWVDFDQADAGLTHTKTDGVVGAVYKEQDPYYAKGKFALLKYDFTKATTPTKASYAVFGGGSGINIEGAPQALQLDVRGDNSLNWIRLEVIDSDNDLNYIDIAKTVNWSGWRTLSVDLTAHRLTYPIKVKRLYVVSVEQGQDERALSGAVAFDNINFQYQKELLQQPKNKIQLTINKREVEVNGTKQTIDQAPYIVAGNTLVPIRFITEALGGEVEWYDPERRVTIYRGTQMVDFWLGQKDYLGDGVRKTAEISPELKGVRSMVPLRVLSEHLGWAVTWDEKTQTITLE